LGGCRRSPDATRLARAHWSELSHELQRLDRERATLEQVRLYIDWLYWGDVMHTGLAVAVARLLEQRAIGLDEIWLYSRAFEDAIDALLSRSRNENWGASAMNATGP
jgi:hypothetical protein